MEPQLKSRLLNVQIFPADFLFCLMNTIGFIGFIGLAMKWPELMKLWENAELYLTLFCKHSLNRTKTFRIRFVASAVLLLALSIEFIHLHLIGTKNNEIDSIETMFSPFQSNTHFVLLNRCLKILKVFEVLPIC